MKITVLAENTAADGLEAEHGLSFWIEYEGHRFLLDAGSSDVFAENAGKLGIPVEKAEFAVLSHGHYDHAGGYARWFRENPEGKVYARRGAFGRYYSLTGGEPRYIGIPEQVKAYRDRFCFLSDNCRLLPGVWAVGHRSGEKSGRVKDQEPEGQGKTSGKKNGISLEEQRKIRAEKEKMYVQTENGLVPDDFSHEQCLVLEGKNGLVILSSCSHAGIDSTIREVQALFPEHPVQAGLGGFHLKGGPLGDSPFAEAEIRSLGETLKDMEIPEIRTGHCTGEAAYAILKEILGERIHRLRSGLEITGFQ